MTEYTVVENHRLEALVDEVNGLINKGWKPQGGICVSFKNIQIYYQVMVR